MPPDVARTDPSLLQRYYGDDIRLPLSFGDTEIVFGAESVHISTAAKLTEVSQGLPGFSFFRCLDAYGGQVNLGAMVCAMANLLKSDEDMESLLEASKPDLFDISTPGSSLWVIDESPGWDHAHEFDLEQEQIRFAAGCLGMAATFLDIRKRWLRPIAEGYSILGSGSDMDPMLTDLVLRLRDPNP